MKFQIRFPSFLFIWWTSLVRFQLFDPKYAITEVLVHIYGTGMISQNVVISACWNNIFAFFLIVEWLQALTLQAHLSFQFIFQALGTSQATPLPILFVQVNYSYIKLSKLKCARVSAQCFNYNMDFIIFYNFLLFNLIMFNLILT